MGARTTTSRLGAALGAVGLISGLVVTTVTPVGAAKPTINAMGSVTCGAPVAGKAAVKPPLKVTAGLGTRTFKWSVRLGCTGTSSGGSVPIKAKIKGSTTGPAAQTCSILNTENASSTTVDIKWTASGASKFAATRIVFSTFRGVASPPAFSLPGTPGVATVTGSYAGTRALWSARFSETVAGINASCAARGLKKLTAGSASSLSLTPVPTGPVATSTSRASNLNPAVVGNTVTFSSTVSSASGTPTGNVSFFDGATLLGTSTLVGGSASRSVSTLSVGTHSITAQYLGSASHNPSTSTVLSQVINKANTSTSLSSNVNPAAAGATVTFSSTVSSSFPTATGNVSFFDGLTHLGDAPLVGGTASLPVSTLTIGTHTVTAGYFGDGSHNSSASAPLAQSVNLAAANAFGWGGNTEGQIGDGGFALDTPSPVRVGSGTDWASVTTGSGYTIALKTDGSLWSWGTNFYGQLGSGTTTARSTPTQVGSASDWAAVSAGRGHVTAVKADGTLWAWGRNDFGQVGDGTNTNRLTPVQIGSGTNWISVSAAPDGYTTLAIKADGSLWAWGYNFDGQLGDGTTTDRNAPVQVGSDTDWVRVSGGGWHSLATKADGTLWAWGRNGEGQVGDGTTTNRLTPVQVGSGTNWAQVASGSSNQGHSLATRTDGTLWAWGYGSNGRLGLGTGTTQLAPVPVGSATDWAAISAGRDSSVGRKAGGTLWAWGNNGSGQLGDGSTTIRSVPVQVGSASTWVSADMSVSHALAVRTDGSLWAWGDDFQGQLGGPWFRVSPSAVAATGPWAVVTAGDEYTLAVRSNGTLWAWGSPSNGQLGDGSGLPRHTPVQIGSATDWATVSANRSTSMAIKRDGSLWAWGYNFNGQFGNGTSGTASGSAVPLRIGAATDWSSVSAGNSFTLAIKTDGSLWSWGSNSDGQLGVGTAAFGVLLSYTTPQRIGTANDWVQVSAGGRHVLARRADGTLWAWGDNNSGQVGDGTAGAHPDQPSPVQVGVATTWADVDAGSSYSLGVRTDGTLWGWGGNGQHQLGDNTTTNRYSPVQIGSATSWSTVAGGITESAAIRTDGTLWAWGDNEYGQLGDGTGIDRFVPTQVGSGTDWKAIELGGTFAGEQRAVGLRG